MFHTFAIRKDNGRAAVIDQQGLISDQGVPGIPIRVDRRSPFKLSGTTVATSAEVKVLPGSNVLSGPRIAAMMTGAPESFRDEVGF